MAVAGSHVRDSAGSALLARARKPSPDTLAVLAIVGIVLLANLPYLSGAFVSNPFGRLSGVGIYFGFFDPNQISATTGAGGVTTPGLLGGVPALDPSNGPVSQALGHRAALDWIHLQVPWWNPYEGTGVPLAGEMQSAALFPPTLLLLIGNGQLYEHVLLELLTGIATYFLLRRIAVGRWASAAGGVAFALNGTFAWFLHAPVNPIAFLPVLLLGIEIAFAASAAGRRGGWWLLAVALVLSVYAGFPETAYIDGLLAVFWFGWRCRCAGRQHLRGFAAKVAIGVIVGLLLAAPLLVAFADYATHGVLGGHTGGLFGRVHIPYAGLAQLVLPYVYGSGYRFFDPANVIGGIWGSVGGYLSATLLFFGLLGLISPGRRGLRFVLLAWIVLAVARMYGEPPLLGHVLGVLPGMSNVAFFRYATPSLELAVVVLGAIGLDGLMVKSIPRRRVFAVTVGALLIVAAATIEAVSLTNAVTDPVHSSYLWASVLWGVVLIGVGAISVFVSTARVRRRLLAAVVCLDALVMFVVPELSAPRSIAIDTKPAAFLQGHLRLSRFFTLGPLTPNYGSYYTVRQLNAVDYPVPSNFATYITTHLDPTAGPNSFTGTALVSGQTPEPELLSHLDDYRAAGVRYVLTTRSIKLPRGPGLFTLVLQTPTTSIYRLAGTARYYTATNPACTVTPRSGASVRLSCSGPTTLVRRETYMAGWSATVNGHATPVREYDHLFQAVTLTKGTHLVTFGYTPPYLEWGVAAFFLGCAALLLPPLWRRARSKLPAQPASSASAPEAT
jgi:hypothetical protein